MYHLSISIALAVLYCILVLFFPLFFTNKIGAIRNIKIQSLGLLLVFCAVIYFGISLIPDLGLQNRILHALGGGFLAFFVCFLGARDSRVSITRIQFFVMSLLIVTTLGVCNEMFEYIVQSITGIQFVTSSTDTWKDLISNTIGALIAVVMFSAYFKK